MVPHLHDGFDAQGLAHKYRRAGNAARFARVFQAVEAEVHALLLQLAVNQLEHIVDRRAHFQLLRRQNRRITVSARIAAAVEQMDAQLFCCPLVFLIEAVAGADGVKIRGRPLGIDQYQNQVAGSCGQLGFV